MKTTLEQVKKFNEAAGYTVEEVYRYKDEVVLCITPPEELGFDAGFHMTDELFKSLLERKTRTEEIKFDFSSVIGINAETLVTIEPLSGFKHSYGTTIIPNGIYEVEDLILKVDGYIDLISILFRDGSDWRNKKKADFVFICLAKLK